MNENFPMPSAPAKPKPGRTPSPAQVGAIGRGLVNLTLMILTIRDIRRRSDDEIKGNRKLWLLAAFAPPIGPIAYFVFGRKRSAQIPEIPLVNAELS